MPYFKYYSYLLIYVAFLVASSNFPTLSMKNEDGSDIESSFTKVPQLQNRAAIPNNVSNLLKSALFIPKSRPFLILLVEEGENSLGIYHSETRKEIGRIHLNFYPHEIEVSPDGKTAYVSNFGIRDYDMKIGYPGNSVSVIDLENFCEVNRLYTTVDGRNYWGPHGVKMHPNGSELYVNVECVNGRYPTSNSPQESMMLIFNLGNNKVERSFRSFAPPDIADTPNAIERVYPILPGTHNFLFAPSDPSTEDIDIWCYAGVNGVTCISSKTGMVKKHYPTNVERASSTNSQMDSKKEVIFHGFNGAVRGLSFNEEGTSLLVSAKNELSIIDLSSNSSGTSVTSFRDLGVGQLFYSKFIPKTTFALAPAARESQVLVVNISSHQEEKVIKRIVTGTDPLQVTMSPIIDEKIAYVTNANSSWVSEIDLESWKEKERILTKGGANGIAFSCFYQKPPANILKLGVCLPFTGQYAAEGRECFLGLEFWQEAVNKAGGLVVNGKRYEINICSKDTASAIDEKELESIVTKLIDGHHSKKKNKGILALFGTYPPSANLILAKTAAKRNIPMITSTGRDPSLFDENLKNVFGISPLKQTSDLKDTFIAIYKYIAPKPKTAMILSCDTPDSYKEAESLQAYLKQNGIKLLSPFSSQEAEEESSILTFSHCPAYKEGVNFEALNVLMSKLVCEARKNCQYYPDFLFIAGHRKETATIINRCAREDFTCGAIASNVGITSYHFLSQVTAPAENLLGSVCWCDTCSDFAQDRFVASTDFQRMFYERYSENPSELVAGFAASGIVIETALKKAKDSVKGVNFKGDNFLDVLRSTDMATFYGPIKFNLGGANSEKPILTVQLRTLEGKLTGVPVWPLSIAGKGRPNFPLSQWHSQ